mmetsp:Transcript_32360/g.5846  ORF Transcript_32360/g.5846 Transcript_32360/m.5846 type:complete len:103 (+) Transcript_32360:174-482(+)
MTLCDCNIKAKNTLHLTLNLIGGGGENMGMVNLTFSDLCKPVLRDFSNTAPRWRHVSRGLNLEGRCDNINCEAFTCLVIHQVGMGKFSINEEVAEAICPICS